MQAPVLSKHPKTSHQGSRWVLPFPTDGNHQYQSAVFYTSWCLAQAHLALMPPRWSLFTPTSSQGTTLVLAPLQGEETYFVRNKMAPDLSILALISRWSLISSLMVLSLLTSSHSSFSSVSSLARVYLPRGVHLTSMPREMHEIPRHSLNGPFE